MKNTRKKTKRVKALLKLLPKRSGRNATGKVTVRHQGGRHKRFWREIDFKRPETGVTGKVVAIEYDPNRTAEIALINYKNGGKNYILAPVGLKIGETVAAGEGAEVKTGSAMSLEQLPVGTVVHNVEMVPGKGAQIARGAGTAAILTAKEGKVATVKLPSGEIRMLPLACLATVGQVGNADWRSQKIGSAGRQRRRGVRPTVRGVAQHPNSHPHGGGEGRSGIGMPGPKTPWGKPALGKRTRNKKKASSRFIIKRRK
ncbi:MAG: 50S ribosomal protein L2 [Candidatus Shapirobacteria bacterium]